jgi:hypothetical protein
MGSEFFDLPVEEQQSSLALFAKELLVQYGITNAQVSCINYEFNATFSVETESGLSTPFESTSTQPERFKTCLPRLSGFAISIEPQEFTPQHQ